MTTLIRRDELPAQFLPAVVAEAVWEGDSDNARVARRLTAVPGSRPRADLRSDEEIADEIRGYLRRGMKVADSAVGIAVEDGLVTLVGQLDRQLLVHRLVEWTCGVSGVVSVTNELTARLNDAAVPFAWGFKA
jgi:osmotically-inducible protein OsmY